MKASLSSQQFHEFKLFVESFASSRGRRRLLSLLETPHGQRTMLAGLDHVNWLDPEFATLVPGAQQTAAGVATLLRQSGAPESCRVLSTNREVNDREIALEKALLKIVAGGAGTILFCVPGKLTYYESEEPSERYICRRPALRVSQK